MDDSDVKIKQQIIDKIKASTNILVTVSRDPSVDDLSSMLGLTVLLNKIGKHATAIFSGAVPPAITFLEPDKIIESTADSLRDFIIALDKEKADHLRYKVDGDVVKIFITPYHTHITNNDLEFSQGDYNVELVLALGVENKEHLDSALVAGGVLQDVTIITLCDGMQSSQLGNLSWGDKNASSLCEMVTVLSDLLKTDKPILDKQISTALLTGIVAATDRFSNTRTTSRVMTTAALLMAAGADQQLIAAKLQESHQISSLAVNPAEDASLTPAALEVPTPPDMEQVSTLAPNNFTISHEPVADIATPVVAPLPQPELTDLSTSTLAPSDSSQTTSTTVAPLLGDTFAAATDLTAEDARRKLDSQQSNTIFDHPYLDGSESINNSLINSTVQPVEGSQTGEMYSSNTASAIQPPAELTAVHEMVIQPPKLDDMPLPPPLPDFSTLPPPPMADFNAPLPAPVSGLNTRPEPAPNDPTQFRIPGQ